MTAAGRLISCALVLLGFALYSPPLLAQQEFQFFQGSDIPGGDYDVIRNTTPQACAAACNNASQCRAFTHNIAKSVCFLKSSASEPQTFAGAISGRKVGQPTGPDFEVLADTDLPGSDLAAYRNATAEQCHAACAQMPQCQAYTHNIGKSVCFLKSSSGAPKRFAGAISGRKTSGSSPGAQLAGVSGAGDKEPQKLPTAELAWRVDDTAATFIARKRAAAKPMGGGCNSERMELEALAASVRSSLGKASVVAGAGVELSWSASSTSGLPPSWLMISADGPVRFEAPGFYALTRGAVAPFGIAADQERTRALTTLFGRSDPKEGKVTVTPLVAGKVRLSVKAVGYLRACEEEFAQEIASEVITVAAASTPTFQVRDPFSFDAPVKVWRSPAGDTKLEVFDGRYRIVDLASDAVIADRQGRSPYYSPTGRFVTADVNEADYEVVDTIDGAQLGLGRQAVLGWENSDSFMVVGSGGLGRVMAHSLLVKDAVAGGEPSCRICSGREESYVLDLENDVVHDGGAKYAQRISGERRAMTAGDPARFIAEQTAAAPFHAPRRWEFRGGLKFTPVERVVGASSDAERDTIEGEEKEYAFFAEELTSGAAEQVAGLQPSAIGRWRGAVALDKPKVTRDTMMERLADLGVKVSAYAEPSFVSGKKPAPGYMGEPDLDLARRIEKAVPTAKGVFDTGDDRFGCSSQNTTRDGRAQIFPIFDQAVEYRIGKRSLWLTMFGCAEGSAAFLYDNFYLYDGANKDGYLSLASDNPNTDIGVDCIANIGFCSFSSRLYADKYLLIWSVESRAIMLFDIDKRETVWIEYDLGRGDLLKEAFYSVEDRHVVQINTDGSFYVYDVAGKARVLEGRYVDDETIAWTPDLLFDASAEGANYVSLRFPGLRGQYAFQQFAQSVKRPGLVREVLERRHESKPTPLKLPPTLSGELRLEDGRIRGAVTLSDAADIRVYQDGVLTDQIAGQSASAQIVIDVSRAMGARWVSVVARDAGGLTSLPLGIDLGVTDLPRTHVLAVGINAYEGEGLASLAYGRKDAATLVEAIRAQDGKSLSVGTTATLLDGEATPDAIVEQAQAVVAAAGKGDTIVFSYAGHGVIGPEGRFYIATTQTSLADIPGTALPWSRLSAAFAKADARVIVFLDACHSGVAGSSMTATNDDAVDEVLDDFPSGLIVFSASKGRQFSEEAGESGGGVFTNAVADVIARERDTADLDRNGAIEASELYYGVKRKVADRTGGRQVPWFARNELIGDFAIF